MAEIQLLNLTLTVAKQTLITLISLVLMLVRNLLVRFQFKMLILIPIPQEILRDQLLLLGDSFDSKLNVNHSTLNLVNNGDSPTSNAIESNSGIVNFNDSNIYSSSRAHYNFNIFNPDHRRGDQQVNFSNTDLKVNTPTDANPYKSI